MEASTERERRRKLPVMEAEEQRAQLVPIRPEQEMGGSPWLGMMLTGRRTERHRAGRRRTRRTRTIQSTSAKRCSSTKPMLPASNRGTSLASLSSNCRARILRFPIGACSKYSTWAPGAVSCPCGCCPPLQAVHRT